jgi:phosphatidylglycerophosphate synthase
MLRNSVSIPARVQRDTPIKGTAVGHFAGLVVALLIGLFGASLATYGPSMATFVVMLMFSGVGAIALRGLKASRATFLGAANVVTTTRAAMVAFLAGVILQPLTLDPLAWTIFAIAIVAFAMDGIDGYLARRNHTATPFGARFDMEIDALLGAVLSLILLTSGRVGPEILVLGFMRYAFVVLGFVWPWLNGPLPESLRRKTICVIQIGALIALLCPITPTVLLTPISMIASATLFWSFAADTLWLKRAAV